MIMTQEEKILLLKDLCARLPYGVKIYIPDYTEPQQLCGIDANKMLFGTETIQVCKFIFGRKDELHFKPYLRPMSSMTEDERRESKEWIILSIDSNHNKKYFDGFGNISAEDTLKAIDWLNSHMFDYRGLIEKGLALPAPEEMYKYD